MIDDVAENLLKFIEDKGLKVSNLYIKEYENKPPSLTICTQNKIIESQIKEIVGDTFEGVQVEYDKELGPFFAL